MVESWMILVSLLLVLNWMRSENHVLYLWCRRYCTGVLLCRRILVHEIPWGSMSEYISVSNMKSSLATS